MHQVRGPQAGYARRRGGDVSERDTTIAASYDRLAGAYAARFGGELAHKPLDRALLDCFAEELRGKGRVVDVGCGPGQITRALQARGLDAMGIDLSAAMIALARREAPSLPFVQGSMRSLEAEDGA